MYGNRTGYCKPKEGTWRKVWKISWRITQKVRIRIPKQKRQAKEKYQKQISAIKLQYTDEIAEEIAKIDKQCEESVEEFCQTVELKKKQ